MPEFSNEAGEAAVGWLGIVKQILQPALTSASDATIFGLNSAAAAGTGLLGKQLRGGD